MKRKAAALESGPEAHKRAALRGMGFEETLASASSSNGRERERERRGLVGDSSSSNTTTSTNTTTSLALPARKVFPIQIGDKLFRLSGASISSDGEFLEGIFPTLSCLIFQLPQEKQFFLPDPSRSRTDDQESSPLVFLTILRRAAPTRPRRG